MQDIRTLFKGEFVTPPEEIGQRLAQCKAFVFDWDGVFNRGDKDAAGSSPFNEVDSMGTNLLRFNHFLRNRKAPVSAIISGETNKIALQFARRESFHAVYCGFRNKTEALAHLSKDLGVQPGEVAFFFDDVLDVALARLAGLRILIGRDCNPYFTEYCRAGKHADYITAASGGSGGLREATEMLMMASARAQETFDHRILYAPDYELYLKARNAVSPTLFLTKDGEIYSKEDL